MAPFQRSGKERTQRNGGWNITFTFLSRHGSSSLRTTKLRLSLPSHAPLCRPFRSWHLEHVPRWRVQTWEVHLFCSPYTWTHPTTIGESFCQQKHRTVLRFSVLKIICNISSYLQLQGKFKGTGVQGSYKEQEWGFTNSPCKQHSASPRFQPRKENPVPTNHLPAPNSRGFLDLLKLHKTSIPQKIELIPVILRFFHFRLSEPLPTPLSPPQPISSGLLLFKDLSSYL